MNNPPVWKNLKISHRSDGESTRHSSFHTLPIRVQTIETFSKNFALPDRTQVHISSLIQQLYAKVYTLKKLLYVCTRKKTYKNVHSTLFLTAKTIKTQKPIKLKNG